MANDNISVFAVVEAVHEDGLQLKIDGEDAAGEKHYKCNTFFKFSQGDRVYCVRDSGTLAVICKIGNPATSIAADTAANATKATTATKATNATNATNAEKATGWEDQNTRSYMVKVRWNNIKEYLEYTHPLLANSTTWLPLLAPLDESVTYYGTAQVVKFRSTSDGKLEYCVPYRSASTWHTITST